MNHPQSIYHFLSPEMGAPIVEFLHQNKLAQQAELILVFSNSAFFPKRSLLNPLRLLDYYHYLQWKNSIKKSFQKFNIPLLFVSNVNEDSFRQQLIPNSIGISTGFNQIFTQDTIDTFSVICNLHPSILPYYRGPTPLEWCLKNKENYSGWTLHLINNKIDEGEILFQNAVALKGKNRPSILSEILKEASPVILEFLQSQLANRTFTRKVINPQEYYVHQVGYKSFIQ